MNKRTLWSGWCVVGALAGGLLGCPPDPKQVYGPADIPNIESLTETMRLLAQQADPWLGRRDDTSFSDDDFAAMIPAAERVQPAGKVISQRFAAGRPEGFAAYAKGLESGAQSWRAAAEAKDGRAVSAALQAIKKQCVGCHDEFR